MEIKVEQLYEAQTKSIDAKGEFIEVEIPYIVFGVENENSALQEILNTLTEDIYDDAVPLYGVLPLERIDIDERCDLTTFKATAVYRRISSSDSYNDDDSGKDEQSTVSFDCGGGTRHVTYSMNQKRVIGNKDAGGYIGWDGKTDAINGVDVPTAQFRETYTVNKKIRDIEDTRYKRLVGSLVGTVNDAPFKGWQKGEVMFLGMSYSTPEKNKKKVTVTYNFMIQPNELQAKIGDLNIGNVEGFEYVWAMHNKVIDPVTKKLKVEVEAAYVEQVCVYKNFKQLGL